MAFFKCFSTATAAAKIIAETEVSLFVIIFSILYGSKDTDSVCRKRVFEIVLDRFNIMLCLGGQGEAEIIDRIVDAVESARKSCLGTGFKGDSFLISDLIPACS